MAELKPCPFCGGEAFIRVIPPHKHFLVNMPDYKGGAFVECVNCSCGIAEDTKEEAIKAWNRRVGEVAS